MFGLKMIVDIKKRSSWLKTQKVVFMLFIAIIASSMVVYFFTKDELSLDDFRHHINNFGIWAPIFFIGIYTAGTIFIPSTPFMMLAGILFGFKMGLVYTIIGSFISAIITFKTSRYLGKDWVENILQNKYLSKLETYNKRLEAGALYDLIVLRILPIMPFNVLNILMGISRISGRDYLLGTTIGLLPSNIATVYAGTLLLKVF